MTLLPRFVSLAFGLVTLGTGLLALPLEAIAIPGSQRVAQASSPNGALCPEAALSRLRRHRIATGETLTSLAQQYDLIPATLMGFNPVLRNGNAPVGTEIVIPPYNGIRVEVPAGSTWRDVAAAYGVRADVLFEVNGCTQNAPRVVFIPGINWAPTPVAQVVESNPTLSRYPLPNEAEVVTGYGWQVNFLTSQMAFHSGVDLQAAAGTPVLAAQDGTVAFASTQGNYGNLVVLNHAGGLQTRYAQLATIDVAVGQTVRRGDRLGTVGQTGDASTPHLHFEVRSNSSLGWVAESPTQFFPSMEVGR
ncbi:MULTISPECIES: M23 family metallopeptidase [unclassified Leptolyngbya]|uniref:peptidoglycan DD-metalloendopeptidase family protein n=1 Tax=unclassified Leptolyngbya TaxID=2650499 RepID=UPI0016894B62|nr:MULTISPECIES: M23 family metallopeptidase [unclassified Leptolyngbya]MBD1909301.1 M23 family metallopeptidase [Leptolyngbya sp. FACHB-8]MBD2153531.1 M23 family metallopeptidase [Leptolyngbya sp. FACHB-16]